jgi:hypothetical protein
VRFIQRIIQGSALKLVIKTVYISMLALYQFSFNYSSVGNMLEKEMKLWLQVPSVIRAVPVTL